MSGLEALGTAASIAQLVQYGIQFAQKVSEIYQSSAHTSTQLTELERSSQNLSKFSHDLAVKTSDTEAFHDDAERELRQIAATCQAEAKSLVALSDSLRASGGKSLLKSIRVAYKTERRKAEIRKHECRLGELRNQLCGQLTKMLYADHCNLASTIAQITRQNYGLQAQMTHGFLASQSALDTVLKHQASATKMTNLEHLISDLYTEGKLVLQRQTVLTSLCFSTMHARYDQIKDPNASTYEWIFHTDPDTDNRTTHFVPWLQQSDGIFWMTGKAGCGKSTLMKYVSQHPTTIHHLKTWAGDRRLITASYYFWNAGDDMQKSHKGLLQSMLYDILCQCPELIDRISDRNSDAAGIIAERSRTWTLSELRKGIEVVSSHTLRDHSQTLCLCLFIDGLDEYHGDLEELVKLIHQIDQSDNIKLCVSSRPWEVFTDSFHLSIISNDRVQLHHHTRDDIAIVAHQELDHLVQNRQDDKDEVQHLVDELSDKAEGVFLWVTLVIQELIKGFRHADRIETLRARLEKIPPGLPEFFDHILRNIDPFYAQESARIFLCCLHADLTRLPLQAFNWLGREDVVHLALTNKKNLVETMEFPRDVEKLRKQLNGRCLDFLQIVSSTQSDLQFAEKNQPTSDQRWSHRHHYVQFLHRTVREYLANADIQRLLHQRATPNFQVDTVLCATYILLCGTFSTLATFVDSWKLWLADHAFQYALSLESQTNCTRLDLLTELMRMLDTELTAGGRELLARDYIGVFKSSGLVIDFLGVLIRTGLWLHAKQLLHQVGFSISAESVLIDTLIALGSCMPCAAETPLVDYGVQPHFDEELLDMLLSRCRSVNEVIYYGDSLWEHWLNFVLIERGLRNQQDRPRLLHITWRLIRHGARSCESWKELDRVLREWFGPAEVNAMNRCLKENSQRSRTFAVTGMIQRLKLW